MLTNLWNVFFGCTHRRTTFPLSVRSGRNGHSRTAGALDTYVVCLDCGKEFAYDWDEMRIVPEQGRKLAGVPEQVESLLTTK